MGITAIFKRPKPTSPIPEAAANTADAGHAPRHIRRRPTSGPRATTKSSSRPDESSKRQQSKPSANVQRQASSNSRKTTNTARSSTKNSELPTPADSGDDNPLKYGSTVAAVGAVGGGSGSGAGGSVSKNSFMLPTSTKQNRRPITTDGRPPDAQGRQSDSVIFGLNRLTTPPPDKRSPELRELDPFEESPPRRPLTNFEDPIYIPPLTLATTLVDEYGIAGASVRHNNPTFSLSAAAAATPEKLAGPGATRSNRSQEADSPLSPEPYNFLGEFNATYSYFFGSPPSESILESQIAKGGYRLLQDSGLLSPSSVSRATPDEKPRSNPTTSEEEGFETAVGSDDGNSADEDDNSADDSSADSSSSSIHDEALEEERRKEEERKAAELRSRRREVIKQQVAFERMKERHRRQYPGQQSSSGLHNNVARWQKESARAVGNISSIPSAQNMSKSQSVLYASNSTINRGGHASGTAQPSIQQPFVNAMGSGQRGAHTSGVIPGSLLHMGANASSSMPNMTAYSMQFQQQPAQKHDHIQHGFHQNAQDIVPIQVGASSGGNIHPNHALGAQADNTGYQTIPVLHNSQVQDLNASSEPVASTLPHPVKLASTPKKIRNPYLSDSSDGSDMTSTSSSGSSSNLSNGDNNSSDKASSAGGSDISCESIPLVVAHKIRGFSNNNTDSARVKAENNADSLARDPEIGAATRLHKTISDSSSDASAKSQSSSKRRVRFHETVSVVFNTHRSIAEEDTENDAYGSDSNSSDASMDVSIGCMTVHQAADQSTFSHSETHSSKSNRSSADDAFDGENSFSHARYYIPVFSPHVQLQEGGASWLESDATNATTRKSTSEESSCNISPDGVKSRSRRSSSRIKTEPLRDHEAEREQQQQHQDQKQRQQKMQQQAHAIGKQVGRDNAAGSESNSTSQSGSNYAVTATIAKAATNTSSSSVVGATEPAQLTVDRVAEARRALLGHYHAPNPSVPVGPGIPRSSGAKPVYTSSVKVVRPQSFSRPKKAYSRGGSAFSPEKPAERTRSFADRKNKPQGQNKIVGTPETNSKQKTVEEAPREDDHYSSQEFELSNVLQNFSIASFEVTKAKDGGMHINYSNRNKPQSGASSFKRDGVGSEDGDDSDGDELPLSAIVRSKSEPARYPAHRPVVSGDKPKRALASEARVSCSSGNSTSNSPNTSPPLFGRASTDQSRRVLVRNQSLAKEKTAFDHIINHDEMSRSVSMDGGPRNPHSQKKHNEGKGRFSRFGGFFS
ncbi:hypothetical protein IWW48_003114 [Coemansia sp. RSA 1200]|nr:hypothetical protein IWW48_003114 [Coemansia sp. RSA 1200]